ncbi:MAG: isocitrate lyase/phosphoenolpyruvate mutase family protein [Robiginitomaculum sp.]|nr:isocitrate lyase/phosphoenolpyruvate mutase family protein [Robiginitomaculum sp.]
MISILKRREQFLALHKIGNPFIIPNPWDIGSAKILQGLGFSALATTSSGYAATLGRDDYAITQDEALNSAFAIAEQTHIPVSADLENGFGDAPDQVAKTISLAVKSALCGGSIEDVTGDINKPIYSLHQASARIEAARHAATEGFVLTARADGFLHGVTDLENIIERLQAFEAAGADVLFAPGLSNIEAVHRVCSAVTAPVNVLIYGALTQNNISDFAQAGAARLSIGGRFAFNAYGTLADTATMLSDGDFHLLGSDDSNITTIKKFLG